MTAELDPPTARPPAKKSDRTWFLCLLAAGCAGLVTGCQPHEPAGTYQGYLEGEYDYVASPYGGALRELNVSRGDVVTAGQPLFALDPEPEAQALREATEKLRKAEAQLADTQKGLRPPEIAALEAQQESAKTDLQLAEQLWQRRQELAAANAGAVSAEALDESKARVASLRAQVARLSAELETARLGAREDQVHAASAEVDADKAAMDRAQWTLDQKKQSAPVAGAVHDTLYRTGEWVAPGNPVVVLLPPENIKVRFFVPEADLAKMKPGRKLTVTMDGRQNPLSASINYVSTRAEFTPPIIYSNQTRSKLVYMVEAKFEQSAGVSLRPGQPVEVSVQP